MLKPSIVMIGAIAEFVGTIADVATIARHILRVLPPFPPSDRHHLREEVVQSFSQFCDRLVVQLGDAFFTDVQLF